MVAYLETAQTLLKVYASCQPDEKASDPGFSQESVYIDPQESLMLFSPDTIRSRSHSQTPTLLESTDFEFSYSELSFLKYVRVCNQLH